jgi:hypothetical protein
MVTCQSLTRFHTPEYKWSTIIVSCYSCSLASLSLISFYRVVSLRDVFETIHDYIHFAVENIQICLLVPSNIVNMIFFI